MCEFQQEAEQQIIVQKNRNAALHLVEQDVQLQEEFQHPSPDAPYNVEIKKNLLIIYVKKSEFTCFRWYTLSVRYTNCVPHYFPHGDRVFHISANQPVVTKLFFFFSLPPLYHLRPYF